MELFPTIHRMRSRAPSFPFWLRVNLILKPSLGGFVSSSFSSSSSSSSSLSSFSSSLPCLPLVSVSFRSFCRRRAARDQTFSLANPIPVASEGRYCHCIWKELKTAFKRLEAASRDESGMVKPYSTGNGRRCFARPGIPRATDLGSC